MKLFTTLILHTILIACAYGAPEKKPNIILIISDDHSYHDHSFMGHDVAKTPNIDRLASESLLYTRGYVMPVCSPSLASLLTGKLPRNHGITGNDLAKTAPQGGQGRANRQPLINRLLDNSLLLPKALSDAGYLTFQTGKLWNTTYKEVGFTDGMTDTIGRHGGDGLAIGRQGMEPIYDFIETAQKQDKPFFIWYAPLMPHDPHTPPADILKKYTGKGLTSAAEKFYAMIEWFDQTCGELDTYLTDKNLRKNTVIIYLADNGWNSSKGYKGGRAKLSPYDGGIRTPMFVRWPGKVTPQRDDNTLASIIDVAPTILKLADAKIPDDLRGLNLIDREAMAKRESVFVEAYTHDIADLKQPQLSLTARVVIHEDYKLIIPGPAKPDRPFATTPEKVELYDLKADPLEKNNLATKLPEKVSQLKAILNAEWDVK